MVHGFNLAQCRRDDTQEHTIDRRHKRSGHYESIFVIRIRSDPDNLSLSLRFALLTPGATIPINAARVLHTSMCAFLSHEWT